MRDVIDRYAQLAWRYWPAAAGLIAFALIASAHGFERIAGLEPCSLCMRQRQVYWAVIAVAVVSAFIWARRPQGAGARAVDALIGGVFLTNAVVAGFHAGVEWGWFTAPPCTGTVVGFDPDALSSSMVVASCDEPAFRIPPVAFGLSMAGLNALIALGLAATSLFAALRNRDTFDTVDERS